MFWYIGIIIFYFIIFISHFRLLLLSYRNNQLLHIMLIIWYRYLQNYFRKYHNKEGLLLYFLFSRSYYRYHPAVLCLFTCRSRPIIANGLLPIGSCQRPRYTHVYTWQHTITYILILISLCHETWYIGMLLTMIYIYIYASH